MRYVRNAAIECADLDGEAVLTDAESGDIYYLDAVTSVLWRLLAEPIAGDEVVGLFAEAFPDTPRETIAGDVAAALDDFVARRLAVTVP